MCVVEGSYEGCMFEIKFVQLGYDKLLGFGLICVMSVAAINSVFSRSSCKYAKSRGHLKINEE